MSGLNLLLITGLENNEYHRMHHDKTKRAIMKTSLNLDESYETENGNYKCARIFGQYDKYVPKSIMVKGTEHFHLMEINFSMEDTILFQFGGMFYQSNPSLMEQSDGSIVYTFPENTGLQSIFNIHVLRNYNIYVNVVYYGDCDSVKLFGNQLYFDTVERRDELRIRSNIEIIQVQERLIHSDDLDDSQLRYEFNIPMNNMTNGYHLTGFRKQDIYTMQLLINRQIIINWDEDDVHVFTKAEDDGLYIPFNDSESDDFSHSLNQTRCDLIQLIFTLKPTRVISRDKYIGIWCNTWNVFHQRGRCCSLKFNTLQSPHEPLRNVSEPVLYEVPLPSAPPIEDDKIVYRPILDTNCKCPFSLEPIEPNSIYHICNQCDKKFNAELLQKWLKDNNSCPLCRNHMDAHLINYINKSGE